MKNCFVRSIHRSIFFIALATLTLAVPSCSKILDPNPKDVIPEKDFPKDFWDAQFLLRGTYQALQPIIEYKFVLGEMRADWVKPGPGADNDLIELAGHKVTPENRYTSWKVYYDVINRANYLIKNVPRVPRDVNNFSEFNMNQYVGEAKFLRSWAYFHLVQDFNTVPLVLQATDDITKVPYLPATGQDVILDSIEADLKAAYAATDLVIMVPDFNAGLRESPEQTRLRVTKGAVCALQAEVYLWRNKYAEAAAACQAWQNTGKYPFILNGTSSWFNIFALRDNLFNEQMFQVNFSFATRETNTLMKLTSNDPASGGRYMVAPSEVAIRTYNPKWPDTISANNRVDELYRGFGNSYAGSAPYYNRLKSDPVIWKYIGLGTVKPDVIDVPANVRAPYQSDARFHIYRQADVYLLWAEALNRMGDKATAITRINTIRGRAGMPAPGVDNITTSSTTEQIEDYILRERGLELGFEGRRWYDLLRIARRDRPRVLIDAVKRRAPVSQQAYLETFLSDPKNWYLPYNTEERRLNPFL
jgi:hypothetical protein